MICPFLSCSGVAGFVAPFKVQDDSRIFRETCINIWHGLTGVTGRSLEVDQYAVHRTPTAAGANLVLVRLLRHCKELVDGFGLGMKGVLKKAVRSQKSVWCQDVQMVLWRFVKHIDNDWEVYTMLPIADDVFSLSIGWWTFALKLFPKEENLWSVEAVKRRSEKPFKVGPEDSCEMFRMPIFCDISEQIWTPSEPYLWHPVTVCVLWRSWRQWGEHMICPFWLESPSWSPPTAMPTPSPVGTPWSGHNLETTALELCRPHRWVLIILIST